MEAPYFPFYPADWLSDPNVQFLSLEEAGAYITLLAYMWRDGKECALPDDDKYLARLLHVSPQKWRKLREILIDGEHAVFKKTSDGLIRNNRLDAEWKKTKDKLEKRSAAAKARWGNEKNANANDMQDESKCNANASDVHLQNDARSESESESDPESLKDAAEDPPLPPVDDMSVKEFEDEVQYRMRVGMDKPGYLLVGKDYQALNALLTEGVSRQFVLDGITETFETFVPKHKFDKINTFVYCAKRIYERWQIEQAKRETAAGGVNIGFSINSRGSQRARAGGVKKPLPITGGKVGRV